MPTINYVNTVPISSSLEEQWDTRMTLSTGSDFKLMSHLFDFDVAFAPLTHFGVQGHWNKKKYSDIVNSISNKQVGLVYFNHFKSNNLIGYEISGGYGKGDINSGEEKVYENYNDYFQPNIYDLRRNVFAESSFTKWYIQPSFKFGFQDEPGLKVYVGMRTEFVDFDYYHIVAHDYWEYNSTFKTVNLTPYINAQYQKKYFGYVMSAGFSQMLNEQNTEGTTHPFYRKFTMSFGMSAYLSRDSFK